LSYVLWLLGYPDQALEHSREAVTLAREIANPRALALTVAGQACHFLRREPQTVQKYTERLQRLVIEKGLAAYQPWVTLYQGWLLVQEGESAEGFARMQASLSPVETYRPYRLTLLAGACLQAGQTSTGLNVLDEALALIEQTGAQSCEAEIYRLQGELLLQGAKSGMHEAELKPEACFRRALEVAH
jgi:predicted ATPase